MALEAVLWAPLLIGCVMVLICGFRLVEARDQVAAISDAAARAASLTADPAAAPGAAREAAHAALDQTGPSCSRMDLAVDTSELEPGGSVRVTITCHADFSDLAGFGIPGSRTFTHTAVVPIDTHRAFP